VRRAQRKGYKKAGTVRDSEIQEKKRKTASYFKKGGSSGRRQAETITLELLQRAQRTRKRGGEMRFDCVSNRARPKGILSRDELGTRSLAFQRRSHEKKGAKEKRISLGQIVIRTEGTFRQKDDVGHPLTGPKEKKKKKKETMSTTKEVGGQTSMLAEDNSNLSRQGPIGV